MAPISALVLLVTGFYLESPHWLLIHLLSIRYLKNKWGWKEVGFAGRRAYCSSMRPMWNRKKKALCTIKEKEVNSKGESHFPKVTKQGKAESRWPEHSGSSHKSLRDHMGEEGRLKSFTRVAIFELSTEMEINKEQIFPLHTRAHIHTFIHMHTHIHSYIWARTHS